MVLSALLIQVTCVAFWLHFVGFIYVYIYIYIYIYIYTVYIYIYIYIYNIIKSLLNIKHITSYIIIIQTLLKKNKQMFWGPAPSSAKKKGLVSETYVYSFLIKFVWWLYVYVYIYIDIYVCIYSRTSVLQPPFYDPLLYTTTFSSTDDL